MDKTNSSVQSSSERINEYPLYPELSDAGKEEAAAFIERFKVQMKKACEEVLGNVYTDVVPFIESDSWQNFRNAMMDGFRNYGNRKVQADYDFKMIREKIYSEFREEIIKDLDQDNLLRIADLQKENQRLRDMIDDLHGRRSW